MKPISYVTNSGIFIVYSCYGTSSSPIPASSTSAPLTEPIGYPILGFGPISQIELPAIKPEAWLDIQKISERAALAGEFAEWDSASDHDILEFERKLSCDS